MEEGKGTGGGGGQGRRGRDTGGGTSGGGTSLTTGCTQVLYNNVSGSHTCLAYAIPVAHMYTSKNITVGPSWGVLTVLPGDEAIDLGHRDDVSEHVTQPLGVHKVQVVQSRRGIVEHYPCNTEQ